MSLVVNSSSFGKASDNVTFGSVVAQNKIDSSQKITKKLKKAESQIVSFDFKENTMKELSEVKSISDSSESFYCSRRSEESLNIEFSPKMCKKKDG